MGPMRYALIAAGIALGLAMPPVPASAESKYPDRPIRIVVPFAAGGATDVLARLIAERITGPLGQSVVVENQPGAGGNVGANAVAKSAPDGYTILMGAVNTHSVSPALYGKLPYDPMKDFAPVAFVTSLPNVLVVNPQKTKSTTTREFIVEAKSRQMTFASSGHGTSVHLSGEIFKAAIGADLVHVPYRGAGPALNDLLAGQVDLMFDTLATSLPHIQAGTLRALGVTSLTRATAAPEIPTMSESGVPGFEAVAWFALFAPSKTPEAITERLNQEVRRAIDTPELRQRIIALGGEVKSMNRDELAAFVVQDNAKWAEVVRKTGVKVP